MVLQFTKNLQIALTTKGITQQELADKLKTTQATINRWIKGVNEPNLTALLEICKLLDETPNSILGYDEITHGEEYVFTYEHADTKLTHKEKRK